MNDTLSRAAKLLRQLASSAFTHDAAGRPVCTVCTFESEAVLVRRDTDRPWTMLVYEIRSHHHQDCELAKLADEMGALVKETEAPPWGVGGHAPTAQYRAVPERPFFNPIGCDGCGGDTVSMGERWACLDCGRHGGKSKLTP